MSVNRPTNVAQKEADVNQKLQLFGIFNAFANGKVPSNKQIDVAMNSALAHRSLTNPSQRLSSEGRELVNDLRDVIEKAKVLLLTKNEGNLLQDFIWQTQNISGANAALPGAPIDKATAQQHGNQALDGLRTLGTLILSNGQFRKLLSDATILLRDIAGDAAQKAAEQVNPDRERLNRIDDPAEDNTWHDVPSVGELKSQAKDVINKNKPLSRQDVKDAAGDATQTAHPSGSRDPRDAANLAAREQQQQGGSTNTSIDAAAGASQGLQSLKDKASNNVDDETKERARRTADATKQNTKNYLNEKMPQERRDQTIWRLKKMVVEIQGHEDYQQAINTLLDLAEEYAGHANSVTSQAAGTVKDAHNDSALQIAERDFKTLLERFANSTSSDDLFESINDLYRDADRDPELKKWFQQMDAYIRKCLKQQGYILEDRATDEWNRLYDQGNFLLRERYRDHTNRIMDEFKFMGDQFDQDPLNRSFADSCQKLFNDLGNDENGKPTFKPHLVKDLVNVIIPAAFESVSYVPIPRIEYSDPMIDAIVENLIVESDNLFPNAIEVASDNHFKFGRKTELSRNKNKIMIAASGVQMDLKDVSYYIRKKQGFPSIKDTGVMDIFMGGTGFSFRIAAETADDKDRQHFFKVTNVTVDIKNLKLKMKQSDHKLLFNLFKPMLLSIVKPALVKVIQKVIKDKFNQADQYCYGIYKEANRAAEEAKNNPDQAQNIYQRYVNAIQRKISEGKQKTKEVTADKQAKIAMTQNDSIFKNIKLPGGISTKATEYQELAKKGDKWESPVFGIGSAAASTNLPRASQITRKPHSTAQGGVRGPQNIGQTSNLTGTAETPKGQQIGQGSSNYGTSSSNYNTGSTSEYQTGAISSDYQTGSNYASTGATSTYPAGVPVNGSAGNGMNTTGEKFISPYAQGLMAGKQTNDGAAYQTQPNAYN